MQSNMCEYLYVDEMESLSTGLICFFSPNSEPESIGILSKWVNVSSNMNTLKSLLHWNYFNWAFLNFYNQGFQN